MNVPWSLISKHIRHHWFRSALTIGGIATATFLFCFLSSVVVSLDLAVKQSASNRLFVQSAVSLFVDLPVAYQQRIEKVVGVSIVSKMQWFGGYYQDPPVLAQFAIDHDRFFDMYDSDIEIVAGPGPDARASAMEALASDRRAAIVGVGLAERLGLEVGDTLPLTPTIFHKADGSAWDFTVVGIYNPLKSNVDNQTTYFRFDYLTETMENQPNGFSPGSGVYVAALDPGQPADEVISRIDGLFENGPQKTQTFTEAAFQAGFISMLGNIPTFLGSIGGAVLFAVLFSAVNTMVMSARQRTHEVGILKALGFGNGSVAILLIGESVLLSLMGGALGIGITLFAAPVLTQVLAAFIQNYAIAPVTLGIALGISAGIGVVAGIIPAIAVYRLRPVIALRSDAV